ncbi:MAG: hypothetical protein K2P99_07275 [Burkholderiales bacterium]|nr:hypothetical protein [Burkholderiales bacterium]
MRKEFVEKILKIMKDDSEVIFFTGDLGYGSFEVIQNQFPERYYNVGIAEQNMIGTACGLGLTGKKVIIYSIANFTTFRVLEQIRNYLIYHEIKALIVNGGGGFSYGQLGYTHHSVEDVSVMKSLPYIEVYAPYDKSGIDRAIDLWLIKDKVAYLRLEKSILPDGLETSSFTNCRIIGGVESLNMIITYGGIIAEALKVKEYLASKNIDLTIVVLNSLKNIDGDLVKMVNGKNKVAVLEENVIYGGIGESFFAKCCINNIKIGKSKIFGVDDFISDVIGDQNYMRKLHGIVANDLIEYFGGA